MCEEGKEMLYWVRSQKAKEITQGYLVDSSNKQTPREYSPTHVTFSRPLGIDYRATGLTTPLESYMVKVTTYATRAYQMMVNTIAPKTKYIERKRETIMNTIRQERDALYAPGMQVRYV